MKLSERLALCWRILRANPRSGLLEHADRELPQAGDDMQKMMNQSLRELVFVFSTHGHSGFSASYAISALERLLKFLPIRPLTGEDDEWVEIADGVWQNKRCSSVFKDRNRFDGAPYDSVAVLYEDINGALIQTDDSARPITFPYMPSTRIEQLYANIKD